ncbi:MAG: hypothetical protein J5732_02810 [Bacteroidaceae bacterium]|nr:hypothetical protein [Bacteroidaceae bacterium]
MTKHRKLITIIKRSCITDKVVWIYQGVSYEAARIAYWRACKKELEKIKHWTEQMADRKRMVGAVMGVLSCSSSSSVFDDHMTDEQRQAARELAKLRKEEPAMYTGFYEHIMEERRRRRQDSEIRRKMRERDKKQPETAKKKRMK